MAMDEQRLTELFQLHRQDVYDVAFARLRDAASAEDIVGATFLQLWRQRELETINNPAGWLRCIAHNLAEDYAGSRFYRDGTLPPERMDEFTSEKSFSQTSLRDEEISNRVCDAIMQLPIRQRIAWRLRYLENLDRHAISAVMECSVYAVKGLLNRANLQLRHDLSDLRPINRRSGRRRRRST
jgi:RNA polymerase sigma-70 factor (ECF subfamily)